MSFASNSTLATNAGSTTAKAPSKTFYDHTMSLRRNALALSYYKEAIVQASAIQNYSRNTQLDLGYEDTELQNKESKNNNTSEEPEVEIKIDKADYDTDTREHAQINNLVNGLADSTKKPELNSALFDRNIKKKFQNVLYDKEIREQFYPELVDHRNRKHRELNIRSDLRGLYLLQIDVSTQLQQVLQSENFPARLYVSEQKIKVQKPPQPVNPKDASGNDSRQSNRSSNATSSGGGSVIFNAQTLNYHANEMFDANGNLKNKQSASTKTGAAITAGNNSNTAAGGSGSTGSQMSMSFTSNTPSAISSQSMPKNQMNYPQGSIVSNGSTIMGGSQSSFAMQSSFRSSSGNDNSQDFNNSMVSAGSMVTTGSHASVASVMARDMNQTMEQAEGNQTAQPGQIPENPYSDIEEKIVLKTLEQEVGLYDIRKKFDQLPQQEQKMIERWEDFVMTLRETPIIMGSIFKEMFKTHEVEKCQEFDIAHRSCIAMLATYCFENLYDSEAMALKRNDQFSRVMYQFFRESVCQEDFGQSQVSGEIYIKNNKLWQFCNSVIDGLQRRPPGVSFTRHCFSDTIEKLSLEHCQRNEMIKIQERFENQKQILKQANKAQPGKVKTFFRGIFKPNANHDEEQQRIADLYRQAGPLIPEQLYRGVCAAEKGIKNRDPLQKLLYLSTKLSQAYGENPDFEVSYEHIEEVDVMEEELIEGEEKKEESSDKQLQSLQPNMKMGADGKLVPCQFQPGSTVTQKRKYYERTEYQQLEDLVDKEKVSNGKFLSSQFAQTYKSTAQLRVRRKHEDTNPRRVNGHGQHGGEELKVTEIGQHLNKDDITKLVKDLVSHVYQKILLNHSKVPQAIRFLLKCVIIQSRAKTTQSKLDYNKKINISDDEVFMLSELFIGSWLNVGFRNPRAFGFQCQNEQESDFEYSFFQACRIVMEHVFSMRKLPEMPLFSNFDIEVLNQYIEFESASVFAFFNRLVNVPMFDEVDKSTTNSGMQPRQSEISSSMRGSTAQHAVVNQQQQQNKQKDHTATSSSQNMFPNVIMRLEDLEIVFYYARKVNFNIGQQRSLTEQEQVFRNQMATLMKIKMIDDNDDDEFLFAKPNSEETKELPETAEQATAKLSKIWRHKLKISLYQHFNELLGGNLPDPDSGVIDALRDRKSEEQYIMFMTSGSAKRTDAQTYHQYLTSEMERVVKLYVSNKVIPAQRANRALENEKSKANGGPAIPPLTKAQEQNYENTIFNIYNCFCFLVSLPEFCPERLLCNQKSTSTNMQNINLTGQSSQNLQSSLLNSNLKATEQMQYQEPENLEKLIQSIHDAERQQIRPSMKIIITCKQILRGIKQIGLERDPAWQKQVLKYFELFLENKLTKLRSRFTDLTRPVQNFSQQIERFEAQLFDIGTFALKSDWNAKLYRILNRGEPDCCILCNTEIVLPDLLKNERGVLLQMACTNHNRKLAVTYTTVFGVLKPNCIHLNLYYGLDLQKNTRLGAQEAADLENYHEWRVTRFREMNKSYMQNCQEIHYLELGQRYVSYVGSTFSGIFDPADDDIKDCLIKDWRVESLDQFCDSYCNRLRKVLQEQLIAEEDDQSKEGMQYDNLLIVKTYEMFINYFAVLHSFSPHQVQECHPTITDEEEPDLEREMRHYDYFIQTMHSDLESKFLRYKVHEFAQRKLYHNLLTWMAPSTNDQKLYVRMQKLVNLPKYQLNYIPKIKSNQDPPADGRYRCIKECTAIDRVTKKRIYQCCEGHAVANCPIRSVRAWCNPEIYKDAINHLSKMLLFETPHSKAQAVQEACQSALLAMEVADVFEDVEYNNAELNLFLIKYLFVQVCCKFRQKDRLPKFYQQLLYVISFDLPMREEAFYRESQSENFLKKQDNELVDDPIKKGEITASQMRNRKMLAKCASVDGKQFVHIMWRFANEILYAPESDFKNL